jgi:hypothetical protein
MAEKKVRLATKWDSSMYTRYNAHGLVQPNDVDQRLSDSVPRTYLSRHHGAPRCWVACGGGVMVAPGNGCTVVPMDHAFRDFLAAPGGLKRTNRLYECRCGRVRSIIY